MYARSPEVLLYIYICMCTASTRRKLVARTRTKRSLNQSQQTITVATYQLPALGQSEKGKRYRRARVIITYITQSWYAEARVHVHHHAAKINIPASVLGALARYTHSHSTGISLFSWRFPARARGIPCIRFRTRGWGFSYILYSRKKNMANKRIERRAEKSRCLCFRGLRGLFRNSRANGVRASGLTLIKVERSGETLNLRTRTTSDSREPEEPSWGPQEKMEGYKGGRRAKFRGTENGTRKNGCAYNVRHTVRARAGE